MAGVVDMFNGIGGQISQGWDSLKKIGADAAKRVSDRFGARNGFPTDVPQAEPTGGPTPPPQAQSPNASMNTSNEAAGARSYDERLRAAADASNARKFGTTPGGAATGGARLPGTAMVPQGYDFNQGKTFGQRFVGNFAENTETARKAAKAAGVAMKDTASVAGKVAGGVARKAPVVANVMEGADLLGKYFDPSLTLADKAKETLRAGSRLGGAALTGAGLAAATGAAIPVTSGLSAFATPAAWTAGTAAGYAGGDWLANKAFGPEKGTHVRGADVMEMLSPLPGINDRDDPNSVYAQAFKAANPRNSAVTPPQAPKAAGDVNQGAGTTAGQMYGPPESEQDRSYRTNTIPTLSGARVSAQDVINSATTGRPTGVPDAGSNPARGTGAFQRTTPGNRGKAQVIDTRNIDPQTNQPVGQGARQQDDGGAAGAIMDLTGRIANLKASQAKEAGAITERELGAKELTSKLAAATFARESENQNRAQNEKVNDDFVSAHARDPNGYHDPDFKKRYDEAKTDADRDRITKEEQAGFRDRVNYTLGDVRGQQRKRLGQLDQTELNQIQDAEKGRRAMLSGRSTFLGFVRNYIGEKQFNSRDLYSYIPIARDKNLLYFKNGNTVDLSKFAGGGAHGDIIDSRLFSPNDPVDADMQARIRKLPTKADYDKAVEEAQKKSQKGAR